MSKGRMIRFYDDGKSLPPVTEKQLCAMANIISPKSPDVALEEIKRVFKDERMLIHGALRDVREFARLQSRKEEIHLYEAENRNRWRALVRHIRKSDALVKELEPKDSGHPIFGGDFHFCGGKSPKRWDALKKTTEQQIKILEEVEGLLTNANPGRPEVLDCFEHLIYVMARCYEKISGKKFSYGKLIEARAKTEGMKFCEVILDSAFIDRRLFSTSSFKNVCVKVASRLREVR